MTMTHFPTSWFLIICIFTTCTMPVSNGRAIPNFRVKSVNLGGWLITEGWIKPSLFDGIPNNDLLDGTQMQLKSVTVGKYLSAESGGGTIIVANRTSASGWETFKLWRINEVTFNLRVFNKQFIGIPTGDSKGLAAVSNTPGISETFQILRNPDDPSRVKIKASNGLYVKVRSDDLVTADSTGDSGWEDDNPSVFEMTIVKIMQGDFQITNGYGPEKAPLVMQAHWSTYILEDDFRLISENGLNAVRIPVGWWIASDPTPPKPFVGGSLQALDNAFSWAEKYGLKVIVDLHAAPGSQNGYEHSGSRDGSIEWDMNDENIAQTVVVIDFLTARYAKRPSFYAMALLNEPLFPDVSLDKLIKYYKEAYEVVRKYTSTAYVVFGNRLKTSYPTELFSLTSGLTLSVIDVHYYNLYLNDIANMTVQGNVDFVYSNISSMLNQVNAANGHLTFIGEWTAEWAIKGATKEDYQQYAAAQLDVFGRASFGWAYWTWKNVNNHWSLEWMIRNGYIKL